MKMCSVFLITAILCSSSGAITQDPVPIPKRELTPGISLFGALDTPPIPFKTKGVGRVHNTLGDTAIATVWNAFNNQPPSSIVETAQDKVSNIVDTANAIVESLTDPIVDQDPVTSDFADKVQDSVGDIFDSLLDSKLDNGPTDSNKPSDAIDAIKETVNEIADAVMEAPDELSPTEIVDTILENDINKMSDSDDEDPNKSDTENITDGCGYIVVKSLSDKEAESLMKADLEHLTGFLDEYLQVNGLQKQHGRVRRKRWAPLVAFFGKLLFDAGRALFKRYAVRGITQIGDKIIQHYSRPGNYFTGLREFQNLKPTNVKPIGGGWTGNSGPYRVTVKSPTLSISSEDGKLVREFIFEETEDADSRESCD